MSTTDQAETRPAWWRCTASSDRRFTVGVAYEVQEYRPDGRAIIVTDMERTLATLPVEDATFVPHDPWNQRNRPTITPADQAETLEATAKRNLRHFIKGAAFKCEVDRDAALNCLDVLEAALNRPTITPVDDGLVEQVRAAAKTYEVMGIASDEHCCTFYRVVRGCVAVGGDHLDAETASAECERLNAKEILASLRSTPPAAGEEGDADQVIMLAGRCGKHFEDDCISCRSALDCTNHEIRRLHERLATHLERTIRILDNGYKSAFDSSPGYRIRILGETVQRARRALTGQPVTPNDEENDG